MDRTGAIRRPTKTLGAAFLFAAIIILGLLLKDHLDLAEITARLVAAKDWIRLHPALAALLFAVVYVAVTGLSLPGATVLTLIGGSLFGLWAGALLVSFASVIGATIGMIVARYFLRDTIERRFPDVVAKVDRGIAADGARYLFALRLIPVIPFFLVNLAMGLTRMPVRTFAWVSQLGMLPGTIVYVNAGKQLASVQTAGDILSPRIILAFAALAALPFVAKVGSNWWSRRNALRNWRQPDRFDYNLIVVGAGSAGLVTAYIAATARARVALIEQGEMGGDCLNTGCVPSKALIRSAKLSKEGAHPERLGLKGHLEPDYPAIMRRIERVIARVAPHDSAERYRDLGVDVVKGHARIADPWTVEVDGRRMTARRLVIATGAEPAIPPIPGLADVEPLTSETLWGLRERPDRLLIVGGGAIGCELAQSFARLGCQTTIVEALPRLLAGEDEDVSEAIRGLLLADDVTIITGASVGSFVQDGQSRKAHLTNGQEIGFNRVVVAVGRRPRTRGFGLEELGLLEEDRLIVDDRLRTRLPTIYAAGDVIGRLQFTHAAGHYAWFAAMNALFGDLKTWKAHTKAFPAVIYTDPEIARVGLSEVEAREKGVAYEVTRYDLAELDRAIADEANAGFIKVLTTPGKDRILGATIVGARAGDMLGEFTLAMRHGLGLNAILRTIHPYPGWMEAAKATAGEWRRAHAPAWALNVSARILQWLRG
ncbi:FAD-dependent oxidoreductase (plasmid) [Rhizobium sullae]|uniref:FAD-dependent oxidoreductase n=1 Tax=Rhizobium sullae TaxID=50338 RepID=A0ABY5XQK3_RHISU|nr:bifunctional TVP38/TMEM64 family protein/FAD-dependent oxidoreductase [Rhizobium sullae]UWU16920.1 FAD-dependent oxidoreductase [Rhizobium sullae]